MKTSESFDGSLGLESFMSRPKNNKSSTNFDTMASLTFSDVSPSDNLLRLNSVQKDFNYDLSKLSRIEESSLMESNDEKEPNTNAKLRQMEKMQKWFREAFNIYSEDRMKFKDNQEKMQKMRHRNSLRKEQIIHLKNMTEYLAKKYKKRKDQSRSKIIQSQKKIRNEIQSSKKRTESILFEIESLEQQIMEQKKLQKKILRTKTQEKTRIDLSQPSSYHHPPHPHYYPGFYPPPHYQTLQSSRESEQYHRGLQRSFSFDQHHPTPQFLSKKTSLNQPGTHNPFPINSELISQALAANFSNHSKEPSSPSRKSQAGQLASLKEVDQEELELDLNTRKMPGKGLTISHMSEDNENVLYSPTTAMTPQFDFSKDGFSAYHQKSQNQNRQALPGIPEKPKRDSNKRQGSNMEESKIRVDVDDSISQMSRFSLEKRRKTQEQLIRQSTIKIQMAEDDSKETSMISDNNTPRLRSPTTEPKKGNSSFEKLELEEVSCSTHEAFNRPLVPPPKLRTDKKLRKITEQQSDMFDSNGNVRPDRNRKEEKEKSDTFSIRDVMLKQSGIGVSEKPLDENASTPRLVDGFLKESQLKERKVTDEEENMYDVMEINLLAVSKISKQKQYSLNFKTISDDGSEIPELRNSSIIIKSQNTAPKRSSALENIEEQDQFLNKESKKRQDHVRRMRKSSGSRFSEIKEPQPDGSLELPRN